VLSKLPRLHLDCVDVEIGNADIAGRLPLWRRAARIKDGITVFFIAAPMRIGKVMSRLPTLAKNSDKSLTL